MAENLHHAGSGRTQEEYAAETAEIMAVRARGPVPRAFVRTYGCQQNVADGEKIKGILETMGFAFTEEPEDADLILFNTCAVREHAEDRVFGNLGALKNIKRKNPSLIIAVCGCMTEQEHVAERIRRSFPFVNLVFGTHAIHRLPEMLFTVVTDSCRVFERGDDSGDKTIVEGLPVHRDGRFKAFLTAMYGCNNFCSYCIVPYVRGRERSRTPEAVETEFRSLIAGGYKDVTLLGQNVNSYGKNLPEPVTFAQLLRRLDGTEGEYWIRFMTSHPKDATKELIDAMAECSHVAHHLHLPVQSGNDRILKEMNRGYTREKYLGLIEYAKKKIPDLSITSDIIVGFPGETYEEFRDTVSLIRQVGYTSLYTFLYSPRKGTRAASMPDPVSAEEKSSWFTELLQAQEETAAKRCASMVGEEEKVLIEERNEKNGLLSGRTGGNIIVEFPGDDSLIGTFAQVKVTGARNWLLTGELNK